MYALEDIADARRRSAEWVPTRFLEGLPDPVDSQLAEQPFPVQQQQEQLDNLLPAQVVDHVGFWDEPSKRAALGLKITLDHMLLVDELLEVVNKKDRPRAALGRVLRLRSEKSKGLFRQDQRSLLGSVSGNQTHQSSQRTPEIQLHDYVLHESEVVCLRTCRRHSFVWYAHICTVREARETASHERAGGSRRRHHPGVRCRHHPRLP